MIFQQSLNVKYNYKVYFEDSIFDAPLNETWKDIFQGTYKDSKCIIFLDKGVLNAFPCFISKLKTWTSRLSGMLKFPIEPYVFNGGENCKNGRKFVKKIASIISDNKLCRHSYLLIIGGGAFIDVVGFAGSIVHRGIRQIRVPTTVLSQNDSGMGVKNGINYLNKKNFLGTFCPPYAVLNDITFLSGLTDRDWISGVSEAFKVAIIKDLNFLHFLSEIASKIKTRDIETMRELIRRAAILHLDHISKGGDPFEAGESRPLDFGHWVAHKLERMTNSKLRHGESVAIGIAIDLCYAELAGFISKKERSFVTDAMLKSGLQLWSKTLKQKKTSGTFEVYDGLSEFREHIGGKLTLIMPNGLGKQKNIFSFDKEIFNKSINYLEKIST